MEASRAPENVAPRRSSVVRPDRRVHQGRGDLPGALHAVRLQPAFHGRLAIRPLQHAQGHRRPRPFGGLRLQRAQQRHFCCAEPVRRGVLERVQQRDQRVAQLPGPALRRRRRVVQLVRQAGAELAQGGQLLLLAQHQLLLEIGPLQVAQALRPQRGAEPGPEERGIERLGQVVLRPHLDAAHRALDLVQGGDDDHRHVPQGGVALHLGQRLVPVQHRHQDVQQHDVVGPRAEQLQRLLPVLGLVDLEALPVEVVLQLDPVEAVVVDHQDPSAVATDHHDAVASPITVVAGSCSGTRLRPHHPSAERLHPISRP